MNPIRIGDRIIGPDAPPFIMLEAGINHNGDLALAMEMIRVAKQAGADAIKFQTFKADEFVGDPEMTFTYKSQGKEVTESMLEMFRRYEFTRDEWVKIRRACDEEGIVFLSTPQNTSDLEILLELGVLAVKVGSDDFTNLPLLKRYARTHLPLLLSCGMSDLAETYHALETVGTFKGYPTILLVCTSEYPTPADHVNISRLTTLKGAFPGLILGFSDHTQNTTAATMAVALGARLFEKHFTIDHNLPGPDHWFSVDPSGAAEWIRSIRLADTMLGSGIVTPSDVERKNKREFQRVLVAAQPILQGEIFSEENLTARRIPGGNGWPPSFMGQVIGRRAQRDFSAKEPIGL